MFINQQNKIKSWLRKNILIFLKYLPIISDLFGTLKGYYRTTIDWKNVKYKNSLLEHYVEIYPKQLIKRLEPKTINEEIDWRFSTGYLGKEFETPATFVAIVSNGRVYGNNGVVITPDNKLLVDVSIEFGITPEKAEQHSVLNKIIFPKVVHTNETVAILSTVGANNYFHWMFDVLPRIHLLSKTEFFNCVDKFIVPNQIKFQEETLNILGITPEKIINPDEKLYLKVQKLVVPSLPGITGSMPKWACKFLRDKFIQASSNIDDNKRIYISRANANSRRIINEDEVIDLLKKNNFQVYIMENLSIAEQASIFNSAKFIVSPHGAALTNLVFCNSEAKVIEIFSPNYLNPCYRALSNQVDIDYWYLLGEGQPLYPTKHDHLRLSVGENIQVNMKNLSAILENVCK